MDSNHERFYKDCCGSIHYCMTVKGSREDEKMNEVPQYLIDQLNAAFDVDRATKYEGKVEGNKLKVWNDLVEINYIHHPETAGRIVKIAMKK